MAVRLRFAFMLSAFSAVLWLLAGCGGPASSAAPASTTPQGAAAAAFVYVASNFSSSNFDINAFSADSNGQLRPIPGSPFAANVKAMAANRNYLFGTDGSNIDSFSIGSDGALTQVSSVNAVQLTPGGLINDLFLDQTGTTLHDLDYEFDGANDGYQSFSVDVSTGALTSLGGIAVDDQGESLSFVGDYGYTANNYHFNCSIDEFKRNNDGTLTRFSSVFPDPAGVPAGRVYCPGAVAAGPPNNLAVSLWDINGSTGVLLATYTADSSGNLTSNSTFSNMPQTTIGVGDLQISPSGEFVAASGASGLQVFHFNGADPITASTGLLTQDPVDHIAWDNDNHLYAISGSTGKLLVFTVTATSVNQAPGSPYTVNDPTAIVLVVRM